MQKKLDRLFWAGFCLVWCWIVLNSVVRWQHNGPAALAVGAVLAAAYAKTIAKKGSLDKE